MARYSRWLIFAPVAILALFAPQANAEPVAGLQTRYFVIDEVPPTRSDDIYTECGSEVENNINRSYEGEPFLGCPEDMFMVHITGTIIIPEHDTIEFWLASDDGGIIDIGGYEFGDWDVKGCSASASGPIDISAGNIPLDFWFYEAYGGTCAMLAWKIDDEEWQIVPDSAFTTNGIPADTTIPDTTIPDTTTTIQETTTTWASTTTSTTITTSTTTTSTIAPSTTVTVTNPSTTTTPQTTSTYLPEPTMPEPPATVLLPQIVEPATPETVPPPPEIVLDPFPQPSPDVVPDPILEVVDTIPEPPDTIVLPPEIESFPPDTLELPPEIVDTMPFPVDTYPIFETFDTLPFVGQLPEPPDTMPLPPDTFPDAPETLDTLPIAILEELPPELVQALEDANQDVSLTEEQFDTVVEAIAELEPAEAIALIEQILDTAVTSEQATELASNPDVLAVVNSEQAEEIFATIDVTELDNTQLDALVEAVQSAPTQVRTAFEETINVFDDGLGDYVPLGSNVPVDTRRTLIAVAAGAATVAAGQRRNK